MNGAIKHRVAYTRSHDGCYRALAVDVGCTVCEARTLAKARAAVLDAITSEPPVGADGAKTNASDVLLDEELVAPEEFHGLVDRALKRLPDNQGTRLSHAGWYVRQVLARGDVPGEDLAELFAEAVRRGLSNGHISSTTRDPRERARRRRVIAKFLERVAAINRKHARRSR